MAEVSDMDLLRDYHRQGSEEAFAALVHRHVNLVYSVALRHAGIASHAEEIAQAVFVILARKAASLRPDTVLEGWLHETTRLTALQFLRGERRRQFREQEAYMQSTLPESADAATWNQLAPLLDDALSRLGQKDRDAVILRFFKDKSVREVAAALKVSEGAAQRRVLRAVEKLRLFFTRRGVVHSSAVLAATISAYSVQTAPAALAKAVAAAAFSKGTIASGSILTLVKGALNRMGWAKAKVAAISGAVLLLGVGATMLAVQADHSTGARAGPDIQGVWEGTATLPLITGFKRGQPVHCRVVARISQSNEVYSLSGDLIDLGKKDIPATRVVYKYPTLRIYAGDWGQFEAKLNADATVATVQANRERHIDLVLQRTNAPDAVPERLRESDFAPRAGADLQGYWKSDVMWVPIYAKIAAQSGGGIRGELDIPALGANHWPIAVIDSRPGRPWVTFKIMCGVGMFQGKPNASGSEVIGNIYVDGAAVPATFTRAEYRAEATPPESAYAFSAKTDLQGHWKTEVDASLLTILTDGRLKKFPLSLDIAKAADGTYSAALVAPMSVLIGWGGPMPATDFKHPLPNVHLEWKSIWGTFDGKLVDGKLVDGKLAGKWNEGGISVGMTFERQAQ
jgi:RNA polymerase sigma factor (sigma-70 family)